MVFIDRVYPESMEILNRGRGAGKSHALALWQLEDPDNRFIVSDMYNGQLYKELRVRPDRIVSYQSAREFKWPNGCTVGFDDFTPILKNFLVNTYGVDVFHPDDSTILVTTVAESELLPGPKELPVNPDYAAKVYDYLNEKLPGAAALLGVVAPDEQAKQQEYTELLESGLSQSEAQGTVWPEPAPVRKRLDELNLGDVIQGKGRVIGIREAADQGSVIVETEDKEFGFEGIFHAPCDTLITLAEK